MKYEILETNQGAGGESISLPYLYSDITISFFEILSSSLLIGYVSWRLIHIGNKMWASNTRCLGT